MTNREMMRILNQALGKRPLIPSIPAWVLRFALGEFSNLFLRGQRAVPGVLEKHGFVFRFPDLQGAAADLIRS